MPHYVYDILHNAHLLTDVVSHICATLYSCCLTVLPCSMSVPLYPTANCRKVIVCLMSVQELFHCGIVYHLCTILSNSCIKVMLSQLSVPLCPTAVLNCDVVSRMCATLSNSFCDVVPYLCYLSNSCPKVMLCPVSVELCQQLFQCDVVSYLCHSVQQLSWGHVMSQCVPLWPIALLNCSVMSCVCAILSNNCLAVMLCPMSVPLCPAAVLLWCCVPCLCHSVQ